MNAKTNIFLITLLLISGLLTACSKAPQEKTPLIVFAAGSLIQPFDEFEKAFEEAHPEIDVRNEYHGSIQVIRHVTEMGDDIDIVASADHTLIPMLMYSTTVPETNQPYADWHLRFATNHLALAYTPQSKYADEITAQNWYEIIARPDVRFGISDPRFDACGYRTLMIFKLAESVYDKTPVFNNMVKDKFTIPITSFWDEGITLITVPEILTPLNDTNIIMRGSSIQLISLLETGDIDYSFQYESVIQQHGFSMISLPDAINLGSPEDDENYKTVEVELDFQRFSSVEPQFTGEQIGYGITIPSNAPHPQEAEAFLEFMLAEEGRRIMENNYHPMYNPITADHYENMPQSLQALSEPAQ